MMSPERLSRYITRAGGDKDWALAIYLYNARLAKSLLYPLSAVEVAVRNAVDEVLVQVYGATWHQAGPFRDNVLSDGGRRALAQAFDRAPNSSRGQIVATLTFDFWSNIFKDNYTDLWRTNIFKAFPHIDPGKGRTDVQAIVKRINKLRNRVAHHEPVLDINISDDMSKIYELLRYRSPVALGWVRHYATVNAALRTFPKRGSTAVTAATIADSAFHRVELDTSLSDMAKLLMARGAPFVCLDNGVISGAITPDQLAEYITAVAISQAGIIDLNDHQAAEVLNHMSTKAAVLPSSSPLQNAIKELMKAGTKILVLTTENGQPEGVIMRAHRRY